VPGDLVPALAAETLKARRSVVPWVTGAAFTVAGVVGAFFTFVLQDRARARALGLLGTKAELSGGTADWAGHLAFTAQITSIGGLLLFGMVVVWLFGRESSDRTVKDLLALPTSRTAVVAAKLLLAGLWCAGLTLLVVLLALVSGALLDLPGWSTAVAAGGVGTVLACSLLTFALATGYGLVASVGRGYLPGVAAIFLTLILSQVVGAVGFGAWFPWSVPALLSGAAGPDQASLPAGSLLAVMAVGLVACVATARWWEAADHPR